MDRIELHLIRSDVLLWVLGGFAEARSEQTLRERILAEAVKHGGGRRFPVGEWAERFGSTPNSVSVLINLCRRQGLLPPSTEVRARPRKLSAQEHSDLIEMARLNLCLGGQVSDAAKDALGRRFEMGRDAIGMVLVKARRKDLLPPTRRGGRAKSTLKGTPMKPLLAGVTLALALAALVACTAVSTVSTAVAAACATATPFVPLAGDYAPWITAACMTEAGLAKLASDPSSLEWLNTMLAKVKALAAQKALA